jgi:L-aspartate oxidase
MAHVPQQTDFLVIGSGIAGLTFALHAARYGRVGVVTKKTESDSNTNFAQGGIACVLDPADTFDAHIRDTLTTGGGICDEDVVRVLVNEGPARIKELLDWGVHFSRDNASKARWHLDLGREGGHNAHRIVHAHDLTGKEVERALLRRLSSMRGVTMLEHHHAVDLITNHQLKKRPLTDRCYGAYIFDTVKRRVLPVQAKVTFLATGGVGRIYAHTTNPEIATGDGIAMAHRAGADIANMEFIQFHPTALFHEHGDLFLISEAARGHGAILRNRKGREFMDGYHPMKSLAPRDVVARAIDREMKTSGEPCVFLDMRHLPRAGTRARFPNIYARCKKLGIDITRDLIPVVPAAHYLCGGIRVDINGASSIPGLYASGEVACTGVHGANRLASNSLLEALVFSRRAADETGPQLPGIKRIPAESIPAWDDSGTIDNEEWVLLSHNSAEIQSVMWDYVGIVRSNHRLLRAQRRINLLEREIEDFYRRTKISGPLLQLRNMVTTARLVVLSALRRHESRGLHYTTDYPEQDDRHWKKDTVIPGR